MQQVSPSTSAFSLSSSQCHSYQPLLLSSPSSLSLLSTTATFFIQLNVTYQPPLLSSSSSISLLSTTAAVFIQLNVTYQPPLLSSSSSIALLSTTATVFMQISATVIIHHYCILPAQFHCYLPLISSPSSVSPSSTTVSVTVTIHCYFYPAQCHCHMQLYHQIHCKMTSGNYYFSYRKFVQI